MAKRKTTKKAATRGRPRLDDSAWMPVFLRALEETHDPAKAAKIAGVGRRTAYRRREEDESFRDDWLEIDATAIDAVEAGFYERCLNGVKEPVFFRGVVCGHKTVWNENAVKFYLERKRPDVYGDKSTGAEQSAQETAAAIRAAVEAMERTAEGPQTQAEED